jgi:hypothetical protein
MQSVALYTHMHSTSSRGDIKVEFLLVASQAELEIFNIFFQHNISLKMEDTRSGMITHSLFTSCMHVKST